jgi:hypothetical protein
MPVPALVGVGAAHGHQGRRPVRRLLEIMQLQPLLSLLPSPLERGNLMWRGTAASAPRDPVRAGPPHHLRPASCTLSIFVVMPVGCRAQVMLVESEGDLRGEIAGLGAGLAEHDDPFAGGQR